MAIPILGLITQVEKHKRILAVLKLMKMDR